MLLQQFRLMTALAALAALVAVITLTAPAPAVAQDDDDDTPAEVTTPSDLTVVIEDDALVLAWTPGQNPEYIGQLLKAWPKDGSNEGYSAFMELDVDGGRYPVYDFAPEATYRFQIAGAILIEGEEGEADDQLGELGYSNVVDVTLPPRESTAPSSVPSKEDETLEQVEDNDNPRRPQGLTAVETSDEEVLLTWTPGEHPRYVAQVVRRRVAEVVPAVWTDFEVGASATSFTDTTAEEGFPYIYRVSPKRSNGKMGPPSNPAQIIGPGAPDNRKPYFLVAYNVGLDRPSPEATTDFRWLAIRWEPVRHPRYIQSPQVLHIADENGRVLQSFHGGNFIGGNNIYILGGFTYQFWVTVTRDDGKVVKQSDPWEFFVRYPFPPRPGHPQGLRDDA